MAREYAPLLGITVKEFLRLRRNEQSLSNGFQSGNRRFAVTLAAQRGVVDLAVFTQHFRFDRLQETVARLQTRAGELSSLRCLNCCAHGG